MEIQYELMSYGVPVKAMPINSEGVMSRKDHLKWVRARQNIERQQEQLQRQRNNGMYNNMTTPLQDIIIPGRFDVILGRGKPLQNHIGNLGEFINWTQV